MPNGNGSSALIKLWGERVVIALAAGLIGWAITAVTHTSNSEAHLDRAEALELSRVGIKYDGLRATLDNFKADTREDLKEIKDHLKEIRGRLP